MQRYFFHLKQGEVWVTDDEGQEFHGLTEAERHGRRVANELARNNAPLCIPDNYVIVFDGHGKELAKIPLNRIGEAVSSQPTEYRASV
jgi:hypothetical protein